MVMPGGGNLHGFDAPLRYIRQANHEQCCESESLLRET